MKFELSELLKSPCPNLWHSLVGSGCVVNGHLEVPDAIAQPLLTGCHEPPKSVPPSAASEFTARLRLEVEKAPLRLLCAACEDHAAGECRGASCCGGQVPVEVRLNLTSTHCPRGKWPVL